MTRLPLTLLALTLTASAAAPPLSDTGTWHPQSKTARAITGEISISDERLTIDLYPFTIAQIRTLKPEEATATFNADPLTPGGAANLYRLSIPAKTRMQGKNTLCGADDTQWMVTYATRKTLQVAFFSGETIPIFTPEAIATTTNLCGTFTYAH